VLDAVRSIHELGIVHGDIKPDNILMEDSLPRLADFEYSYQDAIPVTSSVCYHSNAVPNDPFISLIMILMLP
jgi:serine/threonine protein kinase